MASQLRGFFFKLLFIETKFCMAAAISFAVFPRSISIAGSLAVWQMIVKYPRYTLIYEVVTLLDGHDGPKVPLVLSHGGNNNCSAITLQRFDRGVSMTLFDYYDRV